MPVPNYVENDDFLDLLLAFVVNDRQFLRSFVHLIEADDFKPRGGSMTGRDRWVIATKALEHWKKYREPIGAVLPAALQDHVDLAKLGQRRTKELLDYGRKIRNFDISNPKALIDRVVQWKTQALMTKAIESLIEYQSSGELDTAKFLEISREAVSIEQKILPLERDFFEYLEDRIERRESRIADRYPVFMIEPLDAQVRAIARGHLGCVLAPYKRGKSLFLIHLTTAYVLQRLNVLYITLEDPKADVEDRFDASIAGLPVREIADFPKTLRNRFARFKRFASGRLKVYDGTETGMSVVQIEQLWERYRENGFTADAVIVDYDDEIVPAHHNKDRRFEFAEIYRDLRKFAARQDLLVWTAAQSQRGTGEIKTLGGDHLAEDISKARKVMMLLSIGKSNWKDEDAVYLHVAAHKFDRQGVGCDIVGDRKRMLIYDRERTMLAMKRNKLAQAQAAKGKP